MYGAFTNCDDLIAMCIVRVIDRAKHQYRLANITVRSDLWRRGLGTALFRAACNDLLKNTDQIHFESMVRRSNIPFYAFLANVGFVLDEAATAKYVQDTLAAPVAQFQKDIMESGDGEFQRLVVRK